MIGFPSKADGPRHKMKVVAFIFLVLACRALTFFYDVGAVVPVYAGASFFLPTPVNSVGVNVKTSVTNNGCEYPYFCFHFSVLQVTLAPALRLTACTDACVFVVGYPTPVIRHLA